MINQKSSSKIFTPLEKFRANLKSRARSFVSCISGFYFLPKFLTGFSFPKPPARPPAAIAIRAGNASRHGRDAGGRKRWVGVFAMFFLVLFSVIYITPKCLAYNYSQSQIDELKKRSTYYTDTALQNVQKMYSWDDLQNLQKKGLSDAQITVYAAQGKNYEQALQANADLKQSANQGADLTWGVQNTSGESIIVSALFAPIIAALYVIATFLKFFVGIAGNILDLTLNPSLYNFTGNPMITSGWTMVRDVCNLFFLLALLFIAFCTILKIEKYHARKTLLMLIIMALLINFSKPIAVFIFDGSQLLMNFFLSKMLQGNQSASTMYNSATKIADIIYNNVEKWFGSPSSSGELAIQYLFAIVFLFMLLVAYLVIAIFLIIRIVAVMLLIIVSPFAFFASAIPDFNKLSSSWWDAMFKYCYYGPAAAFFLFLATKLSQHLPQLTEKAPGSASLDNLIKNCIHYSIVIVFLYASIIMANKFSLQFSKAITDRADKFMKWGLGATKTGGMWGWGARRTGVAGGVSQALQQIPYLRTLTKAGRQKGQEEKEAWIAGKLGVKEAEFKNLQKRSREKYKDADSKSVIARAETGDIEAFLEAADRGDADSLKMLSDPKIMNGIRKIPGLRDHVRHLYRKNDQAQFAATLQTLIPDENRAGFSEMDNAKFYADKELKRLNTNKLANVDWEDFAANKNQVPENFLPIYKEALQQRISNVAETNPARFMELASELKGANMNFLKTADGFRQILEKAKGRRGEELDQREA